MPYVTCSRCRLNYYTAASRIYAPECPHCFEPLSRPRQALDKVVSISRARDRKQRTRPS
jgi:hypothetical protein